MADNVALPASGVTAATDEIGGLHYQRVKQGFGGDGVYSEVAADQGLPTSPAARSLTVTGDTDGEILFTEDVSAYVSMSVQTSDYTGETWQVEFQVSNDGVTFIPWVTLIDPNGFEAALTEPNYLYTTPLSYRHMRGVLKVVNDPPGPMAEEVSVALMFSTAPDPGLPRDLRTNGAVPISAGNPLPVTGSIDSIADPVSITGAGDGGAVPVTLTDPVSIAGGSVDADLRVLGVGVSPSNPVPITAGAEVIPVSVVSDPPDLTVDGSAVHSGNPLPVQVGDASAQVNALAGDTGQNAQLVAGSRKEVAFSTTTVQAVASTDVSNYRSYSLHITSQGGSSAVTLQGSNDNVNWVAMPAFSSIIGSVVSATTTTGVWHGPLICRYFRLNVTGIVSGTTAGVLEFFAHPAAILSVDTELTGPSTLSDSQSNPSVPTVGASGLLYNGTSWERKRSATSATGTTGTGLAGAGILGYDSAGAVYRRLLCDASGNLLTRASAGSTSTVTSVSASATNVTLLAANTARRVVTVYNDSTANLFLKMAATASATSFTVKIAAGGYWEMPAMSYVYTGIIDGIWDAANGSARVTEQS